jgi:hypothetical protein
MESIKRLDRVEASKYIGCGLTKLNQLIKRGALDGTFYRIGKRIIFIADRLDMWMLNGGEFGAFERQNNITPLRRIERG